MKRGLFAVLIVVLLMCATTNGFILKNKEKREERAASKASIPPFLFWRWGGKDVVIQYRDVVRNNDSMTANITAYFAIPPSLPNQEIMDIEFIPEPDEILQDKYGQEVACYHFILPPGEKREISWEVKAKIYNIRYILLPFLVNNDIPSPIKENYTCDGEMYKINDPFIQGIVENITTGVNNILIKAIKLHDYVIKTLDYAIDDRWDDAPTVLKRGNGSCSEYCFAYISLCRAAGIPAKYKGGTYLAEKPPYPDDIFHRMVLIYLPNYGWVPVDMTFDEWILHHYAFGFHSNRFFALMTGGGASQYLNWTYNSHYESNARLEVNSTATWLEWN